MKFASQNLRNALQIAKCEPLIRTLIIVRVLMPGYDGNQTYKLD